MCFYYCVVLSSKCKCQKCNLLLVILIEGFKEAAEKFKEEADIKSNVELSGMDSRIKIRDAIQAGKIQEATLMVHQMYPELLDDDRYLFFHLQVCKKFF